MMPVEPRAGSWKGQLHAGLRQALGRRRLWDDAGCGPFSRGRSLLATHIFHALIKKAMATLCRRVRRSVAKNRFQAMCCLLHRAPVSAEWLF